MGMVRQNRIKVFLCVVASLCMAAALISAVLAFIGGDEADLNLLYLSLIAVFLTGFTVSLAGDRYKKAYSAILIKKIYGGLSNMEMETPALFQDIAGKEVVAIMATGGSFKGVVLEVSGGWLKLQDKHGEGLLNISLISSISVIPQKQQ